METVLLKMLFIACVSAQFGKHVYVQQEHEWHHAQQHCRDNYTDLSPIPTQRDEMKLKNATTGRVDGEFWIGLYRDGRQWKWSGGGNATYTPWADTQPDDLEDQPYASVCWHNCTRWTGWHDVSKVFKLPFFCFNLVVMEEKKTWEEAMRHCRKTHTSLTSLASETEHLLALSRIQQDRVTKRVWIGLRYLADHWLWVDRQPLVYRAWSRAGGQDHQCPMWNRCGALTKEGLWESWDCQDELNFICY